MGRVVIIKSIAGDEIIASIVSDGTHSLTISKPRVVTIMQGPNGQPSAGLIPWIIVAPDVDVTIERTALAAHPIDAPMDVEKMYLMQTSSLDLSGKI